jgi:hypothetical protein
MMCIDRMDRIQVEKLSKSLYISSSVYFESGSCQQKEEISGEKRPSAPKRFELPSGGTLPHVVDPPLFLSSLLLLLFFHFLPP